MFNEDWYSEEQLKELMKAVSQVLSLPGKTIEIGCWEGKSTVALANTIHPDVLDAVDTWKGNVDENPNHLSAQIVATRDVFQVFKDNINQMTKGNVLPYQEDCFDYLKRLEGPVRFCHIDACHDYNSVKRTIELLLPKLVKGAILCGDDYINAHIGREDLNGGVQRAVKEMCPGHISIKNFWLYKHE